MAYRRQDFTLTESNPFITFEFNAQIEVSSIVLIGGFSSALNPTYDMPLTDTSCSSYKNLYPIEV